MHSPSCKKPPTRLLIISVSHSLHSRNFTRPAARPHDASLIFLGGNSSSHGFNGWLYATSDHDDPRPGFHRGLHDPGRIPVFADANWVEGWPLEGDVLSADATVGAAPGEGDLS